MGSALGPAPRVIPSVLAADFDRLGAQVQEVLDAGARAIHIDVMDGHFVPPITMGPLVVGALRERASAVGALLEVHLMIEHPERQLAEQTLLNAAVLTVAASSPRGSSLPGIVFDVLLITRAPLQLFQAIQTSLLPHLAGLEATAGTAAFARAIRVTVLAIALFALVCALGLLAIGPFVLHHVFHTRGFAFNRVGLAVVAIGMGLHLSAGTLNQAALARGQAARAAAASHRAAAAFVAWMLAGAVSDQVLRTEIGYAGAAGLLALALAALYRRGSPTASASAP